MGTDQVGAYIRERYNSDSAPEPIEDAKARIAFTAGYQAGLRAVRQLVDEGVMVVVAEPETGDGG